MDLGWVHLEHFCGCTLPTLDVGNRMAAWCETQWKMYVSWFWLCSGFSLFWGCSSLPPVLSLCAEGHGSSSPSQSWVTSRSYWLLQRVTWHWGRTAARGICPRRLLGTGWTNILQKLFKCCWLCRGGKGMDCMTSHPAFCGHSSLFCSILSQECLQILFLTGFEIDK